MRGRIQGSVEMAANWRRKRRSGLGFSFFCGFLKLARAKRRRSSRSDGFWPFGFTVSVFICPCPSPEVGFSALIIIIIISYQNKLGYFFILPDDDGRIKNNYQKMKKN